MEKEIHTVSEKAINLYREAEVKILFLLDQKLETADRLGHSSMPPETRLFIQMISQLFCKTIGSIYEFGLYDQLEKEYFWFRSVLKNRKMPQMCFDHLIKEWNMGIYTFINTAEANELMAPLGRLQKKAEVEDLPPSGPLLSGAEADFLEILLGKDRNQALVQVSSMQEQGLAIEPLLSETFPAVLDQINRLWAEGRFSVLDRHIAEDLCAYVLIRLSEGIKESPPLFGKAVVVSVPGEADDVIKKAQEAFLRCKGWRVEFAGQSNQQVDLFQVALEIKPEILFFRIDQIAGLSEARKILKTLRQLLSETRIILCGKAALIAQKELLSCADAAAQDFTDGHQKALELIQKNA